MSERLFRWRPIVKCTRSFPPGSESKLWNPEENEILVTANDPEDKALKHFECLGEADAIEEELVPVGDIEKMLTSKSVESVTVRENIAKKTYGIDNFNEEERAEMIRRKTDSIDKKDKSCWYRGVPTARELSARLPFSPTHEEIKKALGK